MKKFIRVLIIVAVIIAAIIGYSIYKKKQSKPEWRLASVSAGTIREEVTASGTLSSSSQVDVGTEISGKIVKLYKDFNDIVKKGDLLAKLDTQNLQSALDQAQSDLEKTLLNVADSKNDYDLAVTQNSSDITTDYDMQKAKIKYNQAQQDLINARASVKRAQTNLQYASITSPIDGVIISRSVDEGQTVAASLNAPTLFIIANDLSKMQISADVDEADISKIEVNQPVEFTVDAFADEQFEGTVNQVRLNPTTSNNVVTYSVIINVNNPQLKLLPGMTANVTIIVLQKDNVQRIPDAALRFKPSKELWKLFGLKWDSSFSTSQKNRSAMNGGSGPNLQGNSSQGNNQTGQRGKRNIPDSLRAKLAKMTPEQRKAYISKMTPGSNKQDFAAMTPEQRKAFRDKRAAGNGKDNQPAATQTQSGGQFNYKTNEATTDITARGRVWVLVNGKPTAVEVMTGLSDGTYSEVISGLKEGQEMIVGVNYKNAKQAAAANKSAFQTGGGGFGPR